MTAYEEGRSAQREAIRIDLNPYQKADGGNIRMAREWRNGWQDEAAGRKPDGEYIDPEAGRKRIDAIRNRFANSDAPVRRTVIQDHPRHVTKKVPAPVNKTGIDEWIKDVALPVGQFDKK